MHHVCLISIISIRWTKQHDTMWGLDTNQLEELWMTVWQFLELTDLCHLFVVPTNVVHQPSLSLCLRYYTVLCGISLNDLELNCSHAPID